MTERLLVPFHGTGSGEAPLSWGQRELWGGMRKQRTWMPLRFVAPLPEGTTVDGVVANLRFMMSRYPTLRTRLRFPPHEDLPLQLVAESGEVPLEIIDTDADPAQVADRVAQRYWDTEYDFVSEWPIRMAVIRHGGVPTHQVLVNCHLVTDAFGAAVVARELADRSATGSLAAMSTLEQAAWQGSPGGQAQCQAAIRHWERILRSIPPSRFRAPAEPTWPRYWHATFHSPAAYLAARIVAARTGLDVATALLASFVIAQVRVTGVNPAVTRVVVSNRFRPRLADTVSPISQSGLLAVDVAGITIDEALRRTQRRAMAAYKHAYYDPPQMDALLERVNQARGGEVDIGCFFNDRRRRRDGAGSLPTREQVLAARAATSFGWEEKQDEKPYESLFVHIDDVPDTVSASVFVDTHRVSAADAEACLRELEAVAVAAALDPAAPTGMAGEPE
jgi:hypothetical protein